MSQLRSPRSKVTQQGHDRANELTVEFIRAAKAMRLDFGYSKHQLAQAAGIAHSSYARIEAGDAVPGVELMARVAAALGGRLNFYLQQGTGPALRDHLQAAMIEALLAVLHARWRTGLEVNVYRPVRGTIDAVLDDRHAHVAIATESHSALLRIEQQVRWANAKADALAQARVDAGNPVIVSRLLLLRSTRATRQVAALHADLLAAAYPARHEDAVASLTGRAPWPGAALVWCEVSQGGARLLDQPPAGIRVGRF